MKDDNNSQEMNKKMSEMLSAGKSGGTGAHQENNAARKRLYAVDETLLGTEEGARLSAENLEHAKEKQAHIKQREKESRLNKKKKKKKKKDDQTKEANPNIPTSDATNINIQAQVDSTTVKTAAAAVIATGTVVAVVASVLFGGGRSSR
jgi:sRNA-binding protein